MVIASPMTLTFIEGRKCLKLGYFFNLQYLGQYLSYGIQTWHGRRLMHGIYAHALFDDLELDLDFENRCKTCPACFLFIIIME